MVVVTLVAGAGWLLKLTAALILVLVFTSMQTSSPPMPYQQLRVCSSSSVSAVVMAERESPKLNACEFVVARGSGRGTAAPTVGQLSTNWILRTPNMGRHMGRRGETRGGEVMS